MPKISLYRNISIFFIIFTAMILCAVFLLFYSQGAVIITPEEQDINLNFNARVVPPGSSTSDAVDAVYGTLQVSEISASTTVDVLSTRTADAKSIGSVKLVNESSRAQALVRTTQLQAENGTIVRTSEAVTVPAGGSVTVGVYPADEATFSPVNPGRLTIIKLAASLQPQIYAVVDNTLAYSSGEVKVVAQSDINRAKQQLSDQLSAQARGQSGLKPGESISVELTDVTTDKQIGETADKLTVSGKAKVKYFQLDYDSMADLIRKKAQQSSFDGLQVSDLNLDNLQYSITDSGNSPSIKVSYGLKAVIDASNELLDKSHFTGKTVDEVRDYLAKSGIIKKVEISISPYWKKTLPNKEDRIKVVIDK